MALIDARYWRAFLNGPDISQVLARTDAALRGSTELLAASSRGTAALIENHARDRKVIEQCRGIINRTRVEV